jgi:hypothetical protein
MTLPAAFLGFLIATACGLLFHVVRGGGLSRLGLYVVTAWITFAAGQIVSGWLGWTLWRVGPLNLFPALLAAILGLITASILIRSPADAARGGSRPEGDRLDREP